MSLYPTRRLRRLRRWLTLRSLLRETRLSADDPSLLQIVDVCLCGYTTHGHRGIVANGEVRNDETLTRLGETAVSFATAGADVVAPSAMMDGRFAVARRLSHSDKNVVATGELHGRP